MAKKSILVLGVGNVLLSDEGIGVHAAQKLSTMDLPPEVEVIDGGTGGFELISYFINKKKVIIIDCLETDASPGTMIWTTLDDLELQRQSAISVHQDGLNELLAYSKSLSPRPEIFILGVVPENFERFSMKLSPTLEKVVDQVVQKIFDLVASKENAFKM